LPHDKHTENVTITLEYAFDDWCIAAVAKHLGYSKDFEYYSGRAKNFKNLFDTSTGFFRPKLSDGTWAKPFDPFRSEFGVNPYTEGNAWQHTFFTPHDVEGLSRLYGGRQALVAKMDSLFTIDSKITGNAVPDISGLIGQYAHGNEPSHHIPYMYTYLGQPWKTADRAREIMTTLYTDKPDGLCGNEDCGQMSAWYVMSAMGIYDVCPGGTEYNLGYSIFDEVSLLTDKNRVKLYKKDKVIKLEKLNGNKKLIINMKLGKIKCCRADLLFDNYIDENFMAMLEFDNENLYLKNKIDFIPNYNSNFSIGIDTIIRGDNYKEFDSYLKAPLIISNTRNFKDSLQLTIKTFNDFYSKIYLINTKGDTSNVVKEKANDLNLTINQATNVLVKSYNNCAVRENGKSCGDSSYAFASFYKIPHNWTVKLNCKYNKQYTAGGDAGIIDGLAGYKDWRKGGWQGYQSQDFEAVVDLQKKKEISEISSNYLQDSRSWILLPKEVEYFVSNDGINFKSIGKMNHNLAWNTEETFAKNFVYQLPKKVKARYIKVVAKNYGVLPEGHQGAGGDAFIFVDEIEVK
jgi:hypothetical protein